MMTTALTVLHYFYPQYSNNHKAKLLHSPTLFLLSALLLIFQLFIQSLSHANIKILGYAANISPSEVINLTNQKRVEAGLPALEYSAPLTQAAKAKGEHMIAQDYWAHVAPDGTDPWSFFLNSGYKYRYAGENLARDFTNPSSAVDAWMASPSHRENMLSGKYKEIGIAVVEGDLAGTDTTLIVQLFGTQLSDTSTSVPLALAQPQATAAPTKLPIATLSVTPTVAALVPAIEVTPVISEFPEENFKVGESSQNINKGFSLLLSPFDTTRSVSLAVVLLLLVVMVADAFIVYRKKIPRVSGRFFAHFAFLGMILAIIIIVKAGEIL